MTLRSSTLLILATVALALCLSAQSFSVTPEQAQAMWDNFVKVDPVSAAEQELLSNHPDLKFWELNQLIDAVVAREHERSHK
jgi:hypothetical protein